MSDEEAFLQAMRQAPDDHILRLIFADWLEEGDDRSGELLRLLHTLTQSIEVPQREQLEDRLRSLISSGVKPVGPFITNSMGMQFAPIPPGIFMMGSPEDEEERNENETQYKVTLTKGYYLAIHPVTQRYWTEIIRANPCRFKGDDLPVTNISWDDCQEFMGKLTERDGYTYRLPTEAQWEYACRAATTTPFHFGSELNGDLTNCDGKHPYGTSAKGAYKEKTTAVGSYPANPWGLFDMHGNVWEWCSDWYGEDRADDKVDPRGAASGSNRVYRGGGWTSIAEYCRSAFRGKIDPSDRGFNLGFRLALVPSGK